GVHQEDGRTRYRFLESLRLYAMERLHESGESAHFQGRYGDWCLGLAERAANEFNRRDQIAWFRRVTVEHDNSRGALDGYRVDARFAANELRMAAALGQFWRMQHPSEGRRRLAEALARADRSPSAARAAALIWQASIEILYGDPSAGRALAGQ